MVGGIVVLFGDVLDVLGDDLLVQGEVGSVPRHEEDVGMSAVSYFGGAGCVAVEIPCVVRTAVNS